MGKGSGTCDRPALAFAASGEAPHEDLATVDDALRAAILRQRHPYSSAFVHVRNSRLKDLARDHFGEDLEAAERALDVLVADGFVTKEEELRVEHDADGSKTIERHVDYRNLKPADRFLTRYQREERKRKEVEERKRERVQAREGIKRLKALDPAAREIMTYLFEVGMSYPSESKLKEALDMSQGEVRGALKELREKDLLDFYKRNSGAYWNTPAHYNPTADARSARARLFVLAEERETSITALLS